MNIFFLDENPQLAAIYHCDKHVVKMVLETAQLLSTVSYYKGVYNSDKYYKPTHSSHPCVYWASESEDNYIWLCNLGLALASEYAYRYGREHKSTKIIVECANNVPNFNKQKFTMPALAMPDKYKSLDPISSYRRYYKKEKGYLLSYSYRDIPTWV